MPLGRSVLGEALKGSLARLADLGRLTAVTLVLLGRSIWKPRRSGMGASAEAPGCLATGSSTGDRLTGLSKLSWAMEDATCAAESSLTQLKAILEAAVLLAAEEG